MTGLVLFSLSAVSTLGSMMQADTVPQPGTAQGTVVSTLGRPVARAVLELGSGKARAVSDSLGRFRMTDVPGGKQILSARAIGFAPKTIAIELGTDVGWWGVIELEPDPQPLPEVIAAERAFTPPEYHGTTRFDDFFRRRRLGSGRFLDRAAIKRSNASSLFQLVQGVPGVRVTWNPPGAEQPSYIRMARCPGTPPRMAVYIDGARIHWELSAPSTGSGVTFGGGSPEGRRKAQEEFAEVFNSIHPNDIEMIEIYRGVSELPSDLPHRDICAAIVIYTRWNPDSKPPR